jgi:hypothetical protein
LAVGNYTGGQFLIDKGDGSQLEVDIKNKAFRFNGKLEPHSCLPHLGSRYSVILFRHAAADSDDWPGSELKSELVALGFTNDEDDDYDEVGLPHARHPEVHSWVTGGTIRGIYLFAGPWRHSTVRAELEKLCTEAGVLQQ